MAPSPPAQPPKPQPLTGQALVTILAAFLRIQEIEEGDTHGIRVLRFPLPDCPSCATTPSKVVRTPLGPWSEDDGLIMSFAPCSHRFTLTAHDIHKAEPEARSLADADLPDISPWERPPRHHLTAFPVTSDMERQATERARQAAVDSEKSAAWIAAHSHPATDPRVTITAALTAAAFECDGDCGLSEHECFNAHPITWSGVTAGHTHITGSAADIAHVVAVALGLITEPAPEADHG